MVLQFIFLNVPLIVSPNDTTLDLRLKVILEFILYFWNAELNISLQVESLYRLLYSSSIYTNAVF